MARYCFNGIACCGGANAHPSAFRVLRFAPNSLAALERVGSFQPAAAIADASACREARLRKRPNPPRRSARRTDFLLGRALTMLRGFRKRACQADIKGGCQHRVTSCLPDRVGATAAVPRIAVDLLQRLRPQPWANNGLNELRQTGPIGREGPSVH